MKKLILITCLAFLFSCATTKPTVHVAGLPEGVTVFKLLTKGLDTRFPMLKTDVYDGFWEGTQVLVYALLDGDEWIAFIATWNGEYEGKPWPFARYYVRDWDPGGSWVLTNYAGYLKFIELYASRFQAS